MRTFLLVSLAVTFLGLTTTQVQAGTLWSALGGSCMVDSATVNGGNYISGVTVWVPNGPDLPNSGTINLYCPVFVTQSPTSLVLTEYSSTNATGNVVSAAYYKMSKSTGNLTLIVAQNSTNCALNTLSNCAASVSDTVDNTNYSYFIAVTITNSNSIDNTETFYAVRLSN